MTNERALHARSYEEMPYGLLAHRGSHPDVIATMARLHGITAPPVETCRVLELGCAAAGNLGVTAATLPLAKFVGVDLSTRQIDEGMRLLAAAGIDNVELQARDLRDVGDSLGSFDYIIAHGLYSWVPPEAQAEILAICARSLTPNGLAYVSYNTYPGWHGRGIVRDALLFHTRDLESPRARLASARTFLDWWAKELPDGGSYGTGLVKELEGLAKMDDWYLLHDHLEVYNLPVHFRDMIARAKEAGLGYVTEARPQASAEHGASPESVRARRAASDDLVAAEQYFDFLANTAFRRSLFCRAERSVRRPADPRALESMWISTDVRELPPGIEVRSAEPFVFRGPFGEVQMKSPVAKAAIAHLSSVAPRTIPFAVLLSHVESNLGASKQLSSELRSILLLAYLTSGIIELHTVARRCVNEPGPKPVASPWARALAQRGERVTNLVGETISLDPKMRSLLPLLDGSRDRATLRTELDEGVDAALVALAKAALLVA